MHSPGEAGRLRRRLPRREPWPFTQLGGVNQRRGWRVSQTDPGAGGGGCPAVPGRCKLTGTSRGRGLQVMSDLGDAAGDNANGQDREQAGHGQVPVSRRSFVVGVAAAGAAATAARALPGRLAVSGAPGAGAGRAAVSTCGSFGLVTAPGSGGELTDVAFVSADEWWAVGNVGAALHANRTLIVRFDGSAWSVVAFPESGHAEQRPEQRFHGRGAGWAVGYYQAGGYQPLAMRWDGTAWSLNLPAAFPSDSLFTNVDTLADGTAWAVGFQTTEPGREAR